MGVFEISRFVPAATGDVWRVLTDWPRHARWMPLTRVTTDGRPTGVGSTFVGVTGLGPVHFRDPMTVTEWEPPVGDGPGAFHLRKDGRVLAGWAQVSVERRGAGSLLTWREELLPRPVRLGRLLAALTDRVARVVFARLIDGLTREAVATA
jgi:carbon monoxide dehydrogenase subunit G